MRDEILSISGLMATQLAQFGELLTSFKQGNVRQEVDSNPIFCFQLPFWYRAIRPFL